MNFLEAGTIVFWGLISVYLLCCLFWANKEEFAPITGWGLVLLVLICLFGNWSSIKEFGIYIWGNPGVLIVYAVIYITLGVLWSFVKWYLFVVDYKKEKSQYSQAFARPQVGNYQGDVIGWMTYWPFSLIAFTIRKPFRRIFTFIFEKITGVFEKITNSIYDKS